MGVFKHLYHHQPGPCEAVPGIGKQFKVTHTHTHTHTHTFQVY